MSGHDAAIAAMDELFGPIIGITLVLMSVFLPAAFLPGLTGRMYAQFALVIAATALFSAINAVTLKPTQAALWLRPPVPAERRNFFYRGFNAVYGRIERGYAGLIARMVSRAGLMAAIAFVIIGLRSGGLRACRPASCRSRTRAICWSPCSCPTARRSNARRRCSNRVSTIASADTGVDQVVTIAGVSALDNSAVLANAGVAYVVLKDWSERGRLAGLLFAAPDRRALAQD